MGPESRYESIYYEDVLSTQPKGNLMLFFWVLALQSQLVT